MYERGPPTYDEAIRRDPWAIIVRHLHRRDLVRLASVSKHLRVAANSQLWGNVAQHLDLASPEEEESSEALDSYLLFLQSLATCHDETAALVRTIYLPSLKSVPYDYSRDLLVSALRRASNLQALIVLGTAKFDHALLVSKPPAVSPTLRLLVARNCENLTPDGLAHQLQSLGDLEYLDLSYSKAANSPAVLTSILQSCTNLKVLKLRDTKLTAGSLSQLLRGQGEHTALRCLDVRDNDIDLGRLDYVMKARSNVRPDQSFARHATDLGSMLFRCIAQGDQVGPESGIDSRNEGITHWYLSGNRFRMEEPCLALLKNSNMRVADIGQCSPALLDVLALASGNRLTYLRVALQDFSTRDIIQLGSKPDENSTEAPPQYDEVAKKPSEAMVLSSVPVTEGGSPSILDYLPTLEQLVVMNVPKQFRKDDSAFPDSIKTIFKYFAAHSHALNQVPGTYNVSASKDQEASTQLSLREISLEVQQSPDTNLGSCNTASVTGNTESEELWDAAADDFSFFADEKPVRAIKTAPAPTEDLVTEISKWRTERRMSWSECISKRLPLNNMAKENWPGKVQVIPYLKGHPMAITRKDSDSFIPSRSS